MQKTNTKKESPVMDEFILLLNEGGDDEQIMSLEKYVTLFDEDIENDFIKVLNLKIGESYQYGADNIKRISPQPTPSPVIDTGKHTPGEWICEQQGATFLVRGEWHDAMGYDGKPIIGFTRIANVDGGTLKEAEANAQRIVTACNNFDKLVEALKDMQEIFVHIAGDTKANKLKTDVLHECPEIRRRMNKTRLVLWDMENNQQL